jgi:transcriptional regulator with XRE-family HTH domain
MNLTLKLKFFREYKNWQPEDVAKELGVSIETYAQLETGKSKINGIIAQKLSDLYKAPIELFIIDDTPHYMQAEVVYAHCTFSGGGSNGYINHQYNDRGIDEILYVKKEEIKDLKQQIEQLRRQNDKLMSLLSPKK